MERKRERRKGIKNERNRKRDEEDEPKLEEEKVDDGRRIALRRSLFSFSLYLSSTSSLLFLLLVLDTILSSFSILSSFLRSFFRLPYFYLTSSSLPHFLQFASSIRFSHCLAHRFSCPTIIRDIQAARVRGVACKVVCVGDEHRDTVIEPRGHWSPGTATGRPLLCYLFPVLHLPANANHT